MSAIVDAPAEPRRPRAPGMAAMPYAVPLLFLALIPAGVTLGRAWTFLEIAAIPLVLASLDALLGAAEARAGAGGQRAFRWPARLYLLAQLTVTGWAAWIIGAERLSPLESIGLTLSVGLAAGVFGMVAAHEMVHSHGRGERTLGLAFLASVGDMHFRIAHLHGHHRRAATRADPATARRGESAYAFVFRSAFGQLVEAWGFERARLRRRGRGPFHPANRLLAYGAIEIALLAGCALLGWRAVGFFVAQSALAILLLELFNYIAHYGLLRRVVAGGGLERLTARHSWNTRKRMSNTVLLNMGRHADHHRSPAQSYQRLEPLAAEPLLPSGYAGAILLALVPPLWRRVMHPRLDALATTPPAS